jgi:c-di-GMP-binding flagellar brake protein YcgR
MSDGGKAANTSEISDLVSVGVEIGDELQLQEMHTPSYRYAVSLIGFMNNVGLIVSHPLLHGELVTIKADENFLVRGFSGRKMYQFTARLIARSEHPFPHMFLSYPAELDVINMRSALRIRPNLPCFIESLTKLQRLPAVIEDISTSGARIQAELMLGEKGEQVLVSFNLMVDGEQQAFVMPAIIRNFSEEKGNGDQAKWIVHGLEFAGSSAKTRMGLQSFIYRSLAGA